MYKRSSRFELIKRINYIFIFENREQLKWADWGNISGWEIYSGIPEGSSNEKLFFCYYFCRLVFDFSNIFFRSKGKNYVIIHGTPVLT